MLIFQIPLTKCSLTSLLCNKIHGGLKKYSEVETEFETQFSEIEIVTSFIGGNYQLFLWGLDPLTPQNKIKLKRRKMFLTKR